MVDIDIGIDELYELASIAKSDPYGHPYEQILDNFGNFRCLITPSLIMWLISRLREAEKDAARYRYIKSVCEVIECADGWYLDVLDGQDLDTMVDDCIEAMKESGDE